MRISVSCWQHTLRWDLLSGFQITTPSIRFVSLPQSRCTTHKCSYICTHLDTHVLISSNVVYIKTVFMLLQDHCLVDLLHQWQEGRLPVDITCVIRWGFWKFHYCSSYFGFHSELWPWLHFLVFLFIPVIMIEVQTPMCLAFLKDMVYLIIICKQPTLTKEKGRYWSWFKILIF